MLGENRSPFASIGPYMASFVIVGVTLAALLYVLIMGLLGWQNPVFGNSNNFGYFGDKEQAVYLYESPASVEHFSRNAGKYENLLSPWRTYFSERSRSYKSIKTVADLQALKGGVLVLPSALALGDAERLAITSFRSKGGSVLATWATGTRDDRGQWAGWGFLEQMGAKDVSELAVAEGSRYLVLSGELPVSYSQGAGKSIALGKSAEPLLSMKGKHIAGRLAGADGVIGPDRIGEGAVVYSESTTNASRAVVFAFAESSWEAKPFTAHLLIDDALQWLGHDVSVVKAAWPQAKRSAQVIQLDLDSAPVSASDGVASGVLDFVSVVRSAGYPATAFLTSSAAKDDPQIAQALEKSFEIAYHGDAATGLKGIDSAMQRQRLERMRSDLARVLPRSRSATGFRAPMESYTPVTESIIQQMGIRYHGVEPSRVDDRLPHFAQLPELAPQDDLLLLPRTQRSDLDLSAQGQTAEQLGAALIADFNAAVDTGALGWLSVHSQSLGNGRPFSKGFGEFIKYTKAQPRSVWFANAGQVNQWWRDRERVKVSSNFNGKRLDLSVTITGDSSVSDAGLIMMVPAKGLRPIVRAIKVGVVLPQISPIDEFRSKIVFSELKPGNYNYTVTFETTK